MRNNANMGSNGQKKQAGKAKVGNEATKKNTKSHGKENILIQFSANQSDHLSAEKYFASFHLFVQPSKTNICRCSF